MTDVPAKRGPGRKTKLTPELQDAMIALVRQGQWIDTAASNSDVSRGQVYEWLKRGEADPPAPGDELFVAFAEAFRAAESALEGDLVGQILSGVAHWKALAWYLAARFPTRYGSRQRHEITGADGGPVKVTVNAEQLLQRINALASQAPARARSGDAGVRGAEPLASGASGDPEGS